MEPPEVRQGGRWNRRLAEGVGRTSQAGTGLRQVVLQQPRLGQKHPKGQLVLPGESARSQGRLQQLRRVCTPSPLEGGMRPRQNLLTRHGWHGYEVYILCLAGLLKPTLVWAGFEVDGVRCDTPGPRPPEQ